MSHFQVLSRMLQDGKSLCPLLGCPCFSTEVFQLDWLHSIDQGVTPVWLANMFWMMLPKFPGNSRDEKCRQLFLELQAWYARHPEIDSKLDNLYVSMIKAAGKGPKLRSRAGEARALVPFALELAMAKLSDQVPAEQAAKQSAVHLNACYNCLSAARFDEAVLAENCKAFCLLLVALEATSVAPKLWTVKPKVHQMQELCEFSGGTIPSMTWTYRDEDFGGYMSKTSRRRGGANTPVATSRNVLEKYMAKFNLPVL